MTTDYDAIYPNLGGLSSEEIEVPGGNFRLYKVNKVLTHLGSEHERYEKVRKKYARLRSFFHSSAVTAGTLSAILTTGGIGASLTGPGLIVGIPLSAVGGFLGIVSASCGIATKKITKKISKHEKTIQLIESKENSISDLVSRALNDNKIDEREFKYIMYELQKYEKLKSDIRKKNRRSNERYLKKDPTPDLQKLRGELKKELMDQFINQKK